MCANLNVIRRNIRYPDRVTEKITVGERFPTEVRLVYIQSLANARDVNTMRQRISDLKVDQIEDATVLKQYIEDDSMYIFPQFYSIELSDRFIYMNTNGKIVVLFFINNTEYINSSILLYIF